MEEFIWTIKIETV